MGRAPSLHTSSGEVCSGPADHYIQKAKNLGFLCLLACFQDNLGRVFLLSKVFKADANGSQWLKTKNGPSNPASALLNPAQCPGAATSIGRWEQGLPTTCLWGPTARWCPTTAMQLHLSQDLTSGTEKLPIWGPQKLQCFQRNRGKTPSASHFSKDRKACRLQPCI